MRYLLSVDPGNHSGWALWRKFTRNWYVRRWGRTKGADAATIYRLMTEGELSDIDWNDCHVAVEGQWFRLPIIKSGRKHYPSANFESVAKIVESRCNWVAAAQILGASIEVVPPGVWIPAMTKEARGNTPDACIKWAARQRYPDLKMVADEHAAILLGDYVLKEMTLKGASHANK